MPLPQRVRRPWKTQSPRLIWILLAGILWLGAAAFVFHPNEELTTANRSFAYHRIAETSLFQVYALRNSAAPDWNFVFLDEETIRKDALSIYEHARDNKPIPEAALPIWALLFAALEEYETAREIVAGLPDRSADELNRNRILEAIIAQSTPSLDLMDWATLRWNEDEAEMPELYLLATAHEETSLDEWFSQQGNQLRFRSLLARILVLCLLVLSLVSLLALLRKGKAMTHPFPLARIVRSWSVGRVLFEFFLAFVIASLLAIVTAVFLFAFGLTTAGTIVSGCCIMLFPPFWLTWRLTPCSYSSIGFFRLHRLPSKPLSLLAPGCAAFGLLLTFGYLISLVPSIREAMLSDTINAEQLDTIPRLLWLFVLSVVLAPFCEEIVFRGFLVGGLQTKIGPIPAAILSSSLFALLHGYSAAGMALVLFYGLVFSWLYLRSHSLWPGIFAHGLLNLVIIALNTSSFSYH